MNAAPTLIGHWCLVIGISIQRQNNHFKRQPVASKSKFAKMKLTPKFTTRLKREGCICDWQEVDGDPVSHWRRELKYGANGEDVIQHVKRISTPGRRVYRKAKEMRPVLGGMGITIVSTSSGIFSDREARQKN